VNEIDRSPGGEIAVYEAEDGAVRFRQRATGVLRDHLVRGYSVNAARLRGLRPAVRLIADTARSFDLAGDEARALLAVISEYERPLDLLDDYDHQRIATESAGSARYMLRYEEAARIVSRT